MQSKKLLKKHCAGTVAGVIGGLVVGLVMLFVGLFMINAVYNATALDNTSVFYGISNNIVTLSGTVFSVLGLVIIIVALATAIRSLSQVTGAA